MESRNHGSKRSAAELSEPQRQRSRRARYIQQACTNCKRRKLKCSGGPTCERCIEREEECVFDKGFRPGEPIQEAEIAQRFDVVYHQISLLQRQVRSLSDRLDAHGQPIGAAPTAGSEDPPSPSTASLSSSKDSDLEESPAYIGPTSAEFRLQDVLSTIPTDPVAFSDPCDPAPDDPPESSKDSSTPGSKSVASADLALDRILSLINFYEQSIGVIYPFVDVVGLKRFASRVYQDPKLRSLVTSTRSDCHLEWRTARDIQVLKLVIATAIVAEGGDLSRLGRRLAESVVKTFSSRLDIFEVDLKEIMIATLTSFYYFLVDNDVLAWRFIGFSTRGVLEMGLHRRETWDKRSGAFPGEVDRTWALKMFWCIYVLDRRWSFATGLPLAFRNNDLDADLPLPSPLSPYLDCMIRLERIGEQVWELVGSQTGRNRQVSPEERAALTFRLHKWFGGIPPELRLSDAPWDPNQQRDPTQHEVQLLLYLNAKQMHISVYRDLLLSASSVKENLSEVAEVTQHAKDIVRASQRLDRSASVHSTVYNKFLLSALGALLLVMCHAPSSFGEDCREEFYLALGMLRSNRGSSFMSLRTRKLVQAIQRVSSKLAPSRNASASQVWSPLFTSQHNHAAGPKSIDLMQAPIFEQFSLPNVDPMSSTFDGFSNLTSFFESVGNTVLSGVQSDNIDSISLVPNQGTPHSQSQLGSAQPQEANQQVADHQTLSPGSHVTNPNWINSVDIFGWHDEAAISQVIGELL